MPDHHDGEATSLVEQTLATWRLAFDGAAQEADDADAMFAEVLGDADSEDLPASALVELAHVRARGEHAIDAIKSLTHRVEQLHAEWRAARRYEPEVVQDLAEELAGRVSSRAVTVAREWLAEILEAIDAREWEAAEMLAASDIAWPPGLADGAGELRDGIGRWRRGDHAAGLELMVQLGDGELGGWERVLSSELRSRAYRLAAWVALRHLKDSELAERQLGTAIELWPHAGRMHAERAAYYLSIGDLDMAATDAQLSVELATDDAAGYLELGIWAELSGDFDDADEFYRKALTLLPTFDVARLGRRVALMDPPGRLLTRAAEVLLDARRPGDALRIAEQALHADQRGPELHPQAATHDVRALALEQLSALAPDQTGYRAPAQAAAAALEAGRLHAWNGDVHTAIKRFECAQALDGGLTEVGWLLADARLTTSLPVGATLTRQPVVARALETWEDWASKVGPPQDATSWAYLTRAMIADLGTQRPEADRLAGIWEALLFVEKAIVHDEVDAQRWGYAAQYLRFLHLDELAFEAADRGYKLGSAERQVLAERLAQLLYRGPLDEADRLARELVMMFGNDPWVSAAQAWLAIHSDRPERFAEGLALLELPIAGGNDPSWYYELRALCHVGLNDLGAARAAFEAMLDNALPVDGATKSRLELAAVAIGDSSLAAQWSEDAAGDPTSRTITRLTVDAFAAFARDELQAATELLTRAAASATSVVELRDVCDLMVLRLPLLDGDEQMRLARERVVAAVAAEAVKEREQELALKPPSADQELADALVASHEAGAPAVSRLALLAVKARRALEANRLGDAAASYQELISSSFEPEAAVGLTRALGRLASEQASEGDVERVRELTARMTALGNVSGADVATTVASALETAGRPSDARERLETAIASSANDRERAKLHQRAGSLALADDDLEDASTHLQAALDIAGPGDHGRRGQVQIRMALIAILRDDLAGAQDHLIAAARAWKSGGALDPIAALIGELRGLQRLKGASRKAAARAARELVERAVANGGTDAELEPLRRELGFG